MGKNLDPILEAARQLLEKNGQDGLTMAALAEATGLSRATLYRRAGGREAILERLAAEDGLDIDDLRRTNIRQRILLAVRQAIRENNSFNITIEQVANAAGVGVATVYRHFGDKEKLLQAFSDEHTPRREARELLLHPTADLAADLTRFATGAIAFILEYQDLAGFLFAADEQTRRLLGHMQSNQDRTLMHLKRYFADQLACGRLKPADPFDLALLFIGLVLGLTLVRVDYGDQPPGDPAALARQVVDLFLQGALPVDSKEKLS